MRKYALFALMMLFLPVIGLSQITKEFEKTSSYKRLRNYIDTTFIEPLVDIHDPAYIMPSWEYTLIETSSKTNKYFLFELREKKGMFIVAKYDFRVYLDKAKIFIQNLEKNKFIKLDKWLKEYEVYYNKFGKSKRGC